MKRSMVIIIALAGILSRSIPAMSQDETPLMIAIKERRSADVRALLTNTAEDCKINARNKTGITALMYALFWCNDVVPVLLEHGADTTIASDSGCTPLMLAASQQAFDTVELLCQYGALKTIMFVAKDGRTALSSACANYHYTPYKKVEFLITQEPKLLHVGSAPLEKCVIFNNPHTLNLLLAKRTDWEIKDLLAASEKAKGMGHFSMNDQLKKAFKLRREALAAKKMNH